MSLLSRTVPAALALSALLLLPSPSSTAPVRPRPTAVRVFVGTYTSSGTSQGIYRLKLDLATGRLAPEGAPTPARDPSFLELSADGTRLYAVSETGRTREESGQVSAFGVEPRSGALTLLNSVPSGGAAPCHLALDRPGRHLLVGNYWGGSVTVFALGPGGRLGRATDFVQHEGPNPTPRSEPGPHAHMVGLDPTGRVALVADLGLDALFLYDYDPAGGTLRAHQPPRLDLAHGAGPRHYAFHPSGRWLYVINELNSTVSVVSYAAGLPREEQVVSTLPAGFKGTNSTAEIAVSADGRTLYGSNRGHDSIAVFAIDAASGRLSPRAHVAAGVKRPRSFALDPTGAFLLAAGQDSDTIAVFRVAPDTGLLTPVGTPATVPRPVCLRMAEMR